jgi:hypothetical protein
MNSSVSSESDCACSPPLKTCASGGRTSSTSPMSCSSETPGFAATAISSSLPTFLNSRWAVGRSKPARVAPPIVRPELNWTMPETRTRSTGPSACTPMVSPTSKSSSAAVSLSIATSFGPGQSPSISVSGLKTESPFAMEKPRFGAPPETTAFPSSPMSCVASESTLPSASATPGSPRTSSSSDSSNDGAATPCCSVKSNADFPEMTAFDPCLMSVKIRSNAWSIESVRMNVPLIIATPRTIAIAVRAVRSFLLSSPRIAKRPMPDSVRVEKQVDAKQRVPATAGRPLGWRGPTGQTRGV